MIGFIQKYGFSISHSGTYQACFLNRSVQLYSDEKLCFIFGSEGKEGVMTMSQCLKGCTHRDTGQ